MRSLICLGGPLHGMELGLSDTATNYLDLATASVYLVRTYSSSFPEEPDKGFQRPALVHETIVGDGQALQMAHIDAVMRAWFRAGVEVDLEAEDARAPGAPVSAQAAGSGLYLPGR